MSPLALSLGDPAGIGPEIIACAYAAKDREKLKPFFVVGGTDILRASAELRELDIEIVTIADPTEAERAFASGLPVLAGQDGPYKPGAPSKYGAGLAHASLTQAAEFTRSGIASGLVTAPISKAELAEVGFAHPGQTEFLADVCDMPSRDAVMMLAGPSLRTVPLTVHCALSEVPHLLNFELIYHRSRIVSAALARDFGIERPRLAFAGLNPHAGESGRFGDEEERIISPAIKALREEGIDATGPFPADALFTPRARVRYHAAICMYHDQALIPLKTLEFDEGVNVTLGLPIIRTSPDHGTAYDIAGKGIADAGAMIAAIRLAGECAERRASDG
ncbi:4-hydroxythreonine-4-phosphate dehydrogenase PdxA [Erythrobacter sp. HA6-11]